jgi:WD40 repeat protein
LLKPGSSDNKPIAPGKPEESELYRRLTTDKSADRMPPGDDPLSAEEIGLVKRWIAAGAPFDGADSSALLKTLLPPRHHPLAPEKYPAPAPVLTLAFSPDGKELAVGGHYEVTIWDPGTGKLLRRLQRLPQRIQVISFGSGGKRLLVGGGTPGEYGEVLIVDPQTGKKVLTLGTFEDLVMGAGWDREFTRVAAGCADGSVRAYQAADGKLLWNTKFHSDWVTGIAISPDNKFVVSSGKDRTIKVYDLANGSLYTTYNGHKREYGAYKGLFDVYDVVFDKSGTAYSAGEGTVIRVWNPVKARDENGSAADMEERFAKAGHTRFLVHNAVKPVFKLSLHAGQVFSACGDAIVRQHDTKTEKLIREFRGHRDWVYAIDYHPATHRVASGSYDGEVRIWDTLTGETVKAFMASPGH